MHENFYRAFEDRFRGSREEIKIRLGVYNPFIAPLKTLYEAPKALDLGCGRGEWLELMQGEGFQTTGVDVDDGMLAACRELKLNAVHADFLAWLRGVESDSQSVVSAFHFVEHIPFESLLELVKEAHRVLKPGGLLIMETQNSENLLVGASTFYIDPTHQRPIHPLQLNFVAEYAGFGRIKTLYLQESPELVTTPHLDLFSVLNGVSPDYAVVAQKQAAKEIVSLFDSCFERPYGLRLKGLADRYDQYVEARIQQVNETQAKLEALSFQAGSLNTENQWLRRELNAAQAQAAAQEQRASAAEIQAAQLGQRAIAAEARITAIMGSTSWHLTAPYRKLGSLVRDGFCLPGLVVVIKQQTKQLFAHSKLFINRRPRLRRVVLAAISTFPPLEKRLNSAFRTPTVPHRNSPGIPSELSNLTPQARRIYANLNAAIEKMRKKGRV